MGLGSVERIHYLKLDAGIAMLNSLLCDVVLTTAPVEDSVSGLQAELGEGGRKDFNGCVLGVILLISIRVRDFLTIRITRGPLHLTGLGLRCHHLVVQGVKGLLRFGLLGAAFLQLADASWDAVPVLHDVAQCSGLQTAVVVCNMAVYHCLDGVEVKGGGDRFLSDQLTGLLVNHLAVYQQFPVAGFLRELLELGR